MDLLPSKYCSNAAHYKQMNLFCATKQEAQVDKAYGKKLFCTLSVTNARTCFVQQNRKRKRTIRPVKNYFALALLHREIFAQIYLSCKFRFKDLFFWSLQDDCSFIYDNRSVSNFQSIANVVVCN